VIDPKTPTIIYAGPYKSTDGGNTWNEMKLTGYQYFVIQALAIDPVMPSTLYAGTIDNGIAGPPGIFKSTDGGENWTAAMNGLTFFQIQALAIDPQTPTTLYAGAGYQYDYTILGNLYKSTDAGASWTAITNGLTYNTDTGTYIRPITSLEIDPKTPTTLYAGTRNGGVFKSTDGGGNWNAVNTGLTDLGVYVLAIDPIMPTTLYAGTGSGGVFKSTNGGLAWTAMSKGLGYAMDNVPYVHSISSLAIDPQRPAILYAGTDAGVYSIEQRPEPRCKDKGFCRKTVPPQRDK
jgi:photosystem II stability/assembly factor-like uncharacterized protein